MKKGWTVKKLGELGTANREQAKIEDDQEYELWSVPSFVAGVPEISLGKDIGSAKLRTCPTDVLICKINPRINRVWLVAEPLNGREQICSTEWLVFRTNSDSELYPNWLIHFVSAPKFREWIVSEVSGATGSHTRAKADDILRQEIPVPPLPEQHRIVAILDEAFAGIATAKANAEKNLQNARALFDSYLQSVFSQRGEGWVDRKLGDVCIVERGSSPRPIKKYFTDAPDGVNWIKIGDTEENGKYLRTTVQKITPEGALKSRFVEEGDFILTNSMSFGRPYIVKISGYIHDGWFVLRLSDRIDTEFFYYLLSSTFVQAQFRRLAAGAVVKNISGDLVKKAVLPIPPLSQQEALAIDFLGLAEETQRLESIYERKLATLDTLKKSLLHRAFTGAL